MIISIANISIYSTEQVDGYIFHKNVEDIVLNDNPLMPVTLACKKWQTATLKLVTVNGKYVLTPDK